MQSFFSELKSLFKYLVVYQAKKMAKIAKSLEGFKNKAVEILMHRRGGLQKYFFHASMLGLVGVGLISSGIFGSEAIVVKSFPGVGEPDPTIIENFDPNASGLSLKSLVDFKTSISEKPRAEVINYQVEDGDTLSSIAQKYGISQDTIKWANDMESKDSIKPGQSLKILPVTGVAHTVKSGETLESVAKRYEAEPQAILDFPFNDVPDDFKLQVGQVLIVPEGIPPEAKATPRPKPQTFFASGPQSTFNAPGGAAFMWPTQGGVTQSFAWYHPGIDVANRAAPPIYAAAAGTVVVAGWPDNYGYGNRVVIDHGNGYQTLYAHMSNIYVSVGQSVSRGQAVGKMGTTGRSTGIHLHLEIRFKGIAVNPLAILK